MTILQLRSVRTITDLSDPPRDRQSICLAAVLAVLLGAACQCQAQTSEELVGAVLEAPPPDGYGAARGSYTIHAVDDQYVLDTFCGVDFFGVQFRQYPVAYQVPEGLSASIVAFVFDDQVFILNDSSQLRDVFFHLQPVQSEAQALDVGRSYLRLTEEFVQDMFYRFSDPKVGSEAGDCGNLGVSGQVLVTAGGRGNIDALLIFDANGVLQFSSEDVQVVQGPRPICQATKLLDPDPIVRKMAERDLLYMGRPAKKYLDEQRAKVSPELQEAIDRIWKRIEQQRR